MRLPQTKTSRLLRRCQHKADFILVREFAGCDVWQCPTCGKASTVITRPEDSLTCLACGKGLKGKRRKWCSRPCEALYAAHLSRKEWARYIKSRDRRTCQSCGWRETATTKAQHRAERYRLRRLHPRWNRMKLYHAAMEATGWRILEAHHIRPLSKGGPELDVNNGITLCHLCHDDLHRGGGGPE